MRSAIAFATAIYPPAIGGPASYLPSLLGHVADRIQATVIVPRGSEMPHAGKVAYRTYARSYDWPWIDAARVETRLARIMVEESRGKECLYSLGCGLALGWLAARRRRPPARRIVARFTGYPPWEHMLARREGENDCSLERFCDFPGAHVRRRFGWRTWLLDDLERRALGMCDRIIAPGEYLASVLGRLGVPDDKIRVIPNPVEGFARASARPEGGGEIRMITAGRLVAHKGLPELLEWVVRRPESSLEIAGDGPMRETLEAFVPRDCRDRIAFLGRLSRRVLHDHIARSGLFVLNSRYEGFSHLLAECARIGTPFVATRIPGNEDVLARTGDEAGILFETGDEAAFWKAVGEAAARGSDEARRERVRARLETMLDPPSLYDATLAVLTGE